MLPQPPQAVGEAVTDNLTVSNTANEQVWLYLCLPFQWQGSIFHGFVQLLTETRERSLCIQTLKNL